MFSRFKRRSKEDKAAAQTVTFMVIMLFVMAMLISFIDVGLYFNVKNEMQSAADNGARNVALYGGTNTQLRAFRSQNRHLGAQLKTAEEVVQDSINDRFQGSDAHMARVNSIECGPPSVSAAGNEVFCRVNYTYIGIAGRFGMFRLGQGKAGTSKNDGTISGGVTVVGTSVSEVTSN